FGPLAIHPIGGCCWAARKKPQRQRANYHKTCGVRQFHAVYSVGDDTMWGVCRSKKSIGNSLAAIKSCRAARPDGEVIYVILDNLSAHKAKKIKTWCAKHHVELCFTPTYSSWANPIESHFGPLREFVLNNSDHLNHTVLTRRIHAYLRWRNANARDPEILRLERNRRAEIRAEQQRRWGRPAAARAARAATHDLAARRVLLRRALRPTLVALRRRTRPRHHHNSVISSPNHRSAAAWHIAQRANLSGHGTSRRRAARSWPGT